MRLLIAESDTEMAKILSHGLLQEGYAVDQISHGSEVDDLLRTEAFDAVILNVELAGLNGIEVLKRLRRRGRTVPVIMVPTNWTSRERVAVLDLGADDCIPRSCSMMEIKARVRAVVRRSHGAIASEIKVGPLNFDSAQRRVTVDGEFLHLPRRELSVLEVLVLHAGRVVNKQRIRNHVFAVQDDVGLSAIEIYVHRLRRKLEPSEVSIKTIRGLGYMLEG